MFATVLANICSCKGWFIFTFILLICTLRSTVAFFLLFFTLTLTFLFLAIGYMLPDAKGNPKTVLIHTGGGFGLAAAFLAWYVPNTNVDDYEILFVQSCVSLTPGIGTTHSPVSQTRAIRSSSYLSCTSRGPRRVASSARRTMRALSKAINVTISLDASI